jgi:anti-anti-sigma factor
VDSRRFSINQDAEGVYWLKGELTIHDIEYLKHFLDSVLARCQKITISMGELTYADTAALQLLVAFRRSLKPRVQWVVKELSPEMETILTVSGFQSFLS